MLVDAIIEAAVRVLEDVEPAKFTTKRVADYAGVSVGSLYQYFPNKLALLTMIQQREEEQTLLEIDRILADETLEVSKRVDNAVHMFFKSEAKESKRRQTINAALKTYALDESRAARASATRSLRKFLEQHQLSSHSDSQFTADLVVTTVSSVAEDATSRFPDDWQKWADGTCRMIRSLLF